MIGANDVHSEEKERVKLKNNLQILKERTPEYENKYQLAELALEKKALVETLKIIEDKKININDLKPTEFKDMLQASKKAIQTSEAQYYKDNKLKEPSRARKVKRFFKNVGRVWANKPGPSFQEINEKFNKDLSEVTNDQFSDRNRSGAVSASKEKGKSVKLEHSDQSLSSAEIARRAARKVEAAREQSSDQTTTSSQTSDQASLNTSTQAELQTKLKLANSFSNTKTVKDKDSIKRTKSLSSNIKEKANILRRSKSFSSQSISASQEQTLTNLHANTPTKKTTSQSLGK